MPTVQYTKKRDLVSGSVGESATLEFCAQVNTPISMPKTDELMTMGKAVSSVLENILTGWSVTTVPIRYSASTLAIWREFLHSVAAREYFLYDPTGTVLVPGPDIYPVTIKADKWSFNRSNLHMTVSMEFEETAP
jgi:hypothetical protein